MDNIGDLRQDISILLDNCADALQSPFHTMGSELIGSHEHDTQAMLSSAVNPQNASDPYSADQHLARLSSFNSCDWNIPGGLDTTINELICASNGWRLHTVLPPRESFINHIMCSTCGSQLILRFEKSHADPDFDRMLADKYVNQVLETGHADSCLWRSFRFPLEGSYYLRMHIPENDELMATAYLSNLKSFIDSRDICQLIARNIKPDLKTMQFAQDFIIATQTCLTRRFYPHDKENVRIKDLWTLELAAWGWSLQHWNWDSKAAIILTCGLCFQKIFLTLEQNAKSLNDAAITGHVDPYQDHKLWCRHAHGMVSAFGKSQKPAAYLIQNFVKMIAQDV